MITKNVFDITWCTNGVSLVKSKPHKVFFVIAWVFKDPDLQNNN